MSTLLEPGTANEQRERCYTAADLAAMPDELPSGPVRYELDNGRLISMAPPGSDHGSVDLRIGSALLVQGEYRGHGIAKSATGVILWHDPDRVVAPDALFVANASLPIIESREGYLLTIPDLVVEVVSKNDTRPYVRRKVQDYLKAGVRLVWVVDPAARTVAAHRADQEPVVYGEDDVLTADEIIPGFRLLVRDAVVLSGAPVRERARKRRK